MPEKLDRCISGLLSKWGKNPKEAPKRYKSGTKWKQVKDKDDLRSAAWGICRASTGLGEGMDEIVEAILKDGDGPVLRGVAAVNRPYIKFMRPLEIILRDGREWIRAQIVRFGIYKHPQGPKGKLPFTREFWRKVIDNFKSNIYGQKLFLDWAHEANSASLGEIMELEETRSGVDAWIKPTDRGIEAIKRREINYASIDLVFDHESNQVAIAASELSELEEVDIVEDLITLLAEQLITSEEVDMSEKENPTAPPESTDELPAEMVKMQEEITTMKTDVETQQKGIEEQRDLLAQERQAFATEREEQRESLRRQKVAVFLQELEQPNEKGKRLDNAVLEVIGKLLLSDPIPTSDSYSIQLGEDAGSAGPRDAYYREGIEHLAVLIPCVVPAATLVEPKDKRPSSEVKMSEARKTQREMILMAKRNDGVEITDDVEKEIDEQLDRIYGEEG